MPPCSKMVETAEYGLLSLVASCRPGTACTICRNPELAEVVMVPSGREFWFDKEEIAEARLVNTPASFAEVKSRSFKLQ